MHEMRVTEASGKRLRTREKDLALLRPRSKEWNAAWKGLGAMSGDADFLAEDPKSGEVW